jgi:hypothetical protein
LSISPVCESPTTIAGRYTVHGTFDSLRTIFSLSCLVMKYGWSEPFGLLEHVFAEHAFVEVRPRRSS